MTKYAGLSVIRGTHSHHQHTGDSLIVDFAQIENLIVGVVTITEVDIARAQVGLLTFTQELDI